MIMKRREFITLLGGVVAAWPLTTRAQQPTAMGPQARVGVLTASPPSSGMLNAFREGMRERGYFEGQNLSIVVRWPQGTFEQNPTVASEIVGTNVDVIIAWSTPAVIAASRATSSIPIVMVSVGDPVGLLPVWRDLAETSPVSATSVRISAPSFWRCSPSLFPG
jgi:putative ABC transport system substrate-binding protein